MFNTILVPLDGSAHAERAIPFALSLPADHVILLHVATRGELIQLSHAYLSDLSQRYVATSQRATTVFRHGSPVTEIINEVNEALVELVVMSTLGSSSLQHRLMGSVPYTLMHRLPVPLLLLNPCNIPTNDRIVLVLDSAVRAAGTLPALEQLGPLMTFIGNFASATSKAVTIFTASYPDANVLSALDPSATLEEMQGYNEYLPCMVADILRELGRGLQAQPVDISVASNRIESHTALCDYLHQQSAGLVVFAMQRQCSYGRQIVDSLMRTTLGDCNTPVLLYPIHPPVIPAALPVFAEAVRR